MTRRFLLYLLVPLLLAALGGALAFWLWKIGRAHV